MTQLRLRSASLIACFTITIGALGLSCGRAPSLNPSYPSAAYLNFRDDMLAASLQQMGAVEDWCRTVHAHAKALGDNAAYDCFVTLPFPTFDHRQLKPTGGLVQFTWMVPKTDYLRMLDEQERYDFLRGYGATVVLWCSGASESSFVERQPQRESVDLCAELQSE